MKFILGLAAVLVIAFLAIVGGTLIGIISAVVVAYVFPGTMALLALKLGIPTIWQMGAILGFIGGFFKASTTVSKD